MQPPTLVSVSEDTEPVLVRAQFHPLVRHYLFLVALFTMIATIFGIILVPIWVLGLGQWWARRYYGHLDCVLRERSLYFRRGVLIRAESTIPLDRITDLTVKEGPLLRALGLSCIRVETPGSSGQSMGGGVTMVGIVDSPAFRQRVFAQRDALRRADSADSPQHHQASQQALTLLQEMRDGLLEIRDGVQHIRKRLDS